jgi:hypothetical protein
MSACGARTGPELATWSPVTGATTTGAGGAGTAGAGGVSSSTQDVCASAVSGPKAMARNCSTRDGRSRVTAPAKPHVTWTTKLPTDSTGHVGLSAIATGAAGDAYVVTSENLADEGAIRRVRTSDGAIEWTLSLAPDGATQTPVVRADGLIDLSAYSAGNKPSTLLIDAKTGAATDTTFGFDLYDEAGNHAIGADGSLYLLHSESVGTAMSKTFVSRVSPGGSSTWTVDVGAAAGVKPGGSVFPSTLALGPGDRVFTVVDTIPTLVAVAVDASTGATAWTTSLPGQVLGGPAVRPDGSVALLAGPANAPNLVIFDGQTGTMTSRALGFEVAEIFAVTTTGVVIAGTDAGMGVDGLVAIDADGKAIWKTPGAFRGATVALGGTIVAFGTTIVSLSETTGTTLWSLVPPIPSSCLADVALTSAGGIVALQCDGTLFGASD